MPVGVAPEHEDLRRAVRRWVEAHCPPEVPRAALEGAPDELPTVWKALAEQGWLGLHVDEADGGEGFGLVELAVVVEELGRALVPGPLLPTLVASAAVARHGSPATRRALLGGLLDGTSPAGVYVGSGSLAAAGRPGGADGELPDGELPDGELIVEGTLRPVVGGPQAGRWLVPVAGHGWCVLEAGEAVAMAALPSLDPTVPLGELTATAAPVAASHRLPDLSGEEVRDLALVVAAAQAAGGARWCLETASAYAKERVQFGRPIGQFQAVKHKLADMLVAVEQADAVAWDAAQASTVPAGSVPLASAPAGTTTAGAAEGGTGPAGPAARSGGSPVAGGDVAAGGPSRPPGAEPEAALAAAVAGSLALEGFAAAAKTCIQLLGGIGFTWEHDAHLYLRRAVATRQLLGGGADHDRRVAALALAGARRSLAADLPPEAEDVRRAVAPLVAEVAALEGRAQKEAMVETGLHSPHWPAPWGRDASPLEQLVVDEELAAAGVARQHLGVGAWALPTLIAHGTPAQHARWVRPTLLGELTWCQLFSEPGAGSDLASLTTRATRVDGGWRLTGQKVWTSMAHLADWGICLARSDPAAPKHEGITYFVVDMRAEGVEVRPLRELTGDALFNEVFLTDVFVPDDCVVGEPGGGWAIARTTLANERVSMSSGATFGVGAESVLHRLARLGDAAPAGAALAVGALLAEAQSVRLLGHRATLRSLSGTDPGSGASVRKLLGAEHEQRVQELGLELYGPAGAVLEGSGQRWGHGFLVTRCLTIAGGTSEVQRNVMAERILGQPRDPEPTA